MDIWKCQPFLIRRQNRIINGFLSMSSFFPRSFTYCEIMKYELNKSTNSDVETAVLKGRIATPG